MIAHQRKWRGAREKQIIYVAGLCQIDRVQRLEQLRDTRAVVESATSKDTGHKNNDKKTKPLRFGGQHVREMIEREKADQTW